MRIGATFGSYFMKKVSNGRCLWDIDWFLWGARAQTDILISYKLLKRRRLQCPKDRDLCRPGMVFCTSCAFFDFIIAQTSWKKELKSLLNRNLRFNSNYKEERKSAQRNNRCFLAVVIFSNVVHSITLRHIWDFIKLTFYKDAAKTEETSNDNFFRLSPNISCITITP